MSKRKDNDLEVAYLPKSRSVIEITSSANVRKSASTKKLDGFTYEKFGNDDKLPDDILKAVWENDFMPQLLETATAFLHGSGLGIFQKRIVAATDKVGAKTIIEPVENTAISQWMEQVDLDQLWLEACTQFVEGANVYIQFNLNAFGKPVEMKVYDWTTIRAQEQNEETGQIDNYLLLGERKVAGKTVKIQAIPRYYKGIENEQEQFIYHARKKTSGQISYALNPWFGALETIKVLNKIPKFHSSGLDNGYNVKHHVKIPASWLDKFGERGSKERATAWNELQTRMDETLAGVKNVNKAIMTEFITDNMGKPLPGVEIIPIEGNPSDKSYIELMQALRVNASTSVGIHPGLANVDTGGKLGGTASEMRVAAQLHTALRTPIPRKLLLKPINIAMKMMGFPPEYFLQPIDFQLETLDKNPTGTKEVTNSANAPA